MVRKILSIYEWLSNNDLYELAAICVGRCKTDLRVVERNTENIVEIIDELDVEINILRMPVRE